MLPPKSLLSVEGDSALLPRHESPWQNFLDLFRSIDEGSPSGTCPATTAACSARTRRLTTFSLTTSGRTSSRTSATTTSRRSQRRCPGPSVREVHQRHGAIRVAGGSSKLRATEAVSPKMEKSAERKRCGIYYTPPEFTGFIVEQTVGQIATREDAEPSRRSTGSTSTIPEVHTAGRQAQALRGGCGCGACGRSGSSIPPAAAGPS